MLNIKLLRENPSFVIERLAVKNFDAATIIAKTAELDVKKRNAQTEADSLLANQNSIAKEIGALMKEGKKEQAESAKSRVAQLKESSKIIETKMEEYAKELNDLLLLLPNLPHSSVPSGKTPEDNVIVREGGEIPSLKTATPHWELAKNMILLISTLGLNLQVRDSRFIKARGQKYSELLSPIFWIKILKPATQRLCRH